MHYTEKDKMTGYKRIFLMAFLGTVLSTSAGVRAQAPKQKPAQKPTTKQTAPVSAASAGVVGPQQTKHYPILVVAHGNEPFWSLRFGM